MRVFLSSTAQDLVAYRKVADDTILRLSQEAVVMERFGPLPGEPVQACERKARDSDVVVCIVAHRYGFVPEAGRGSITRREVEAAKAAGRDVLVWIVADDFPWTEKKEQDQLVDPAVLADPARIAQVASAVGALGDFKAWLRASFGCETFTTPDDLGRKIALALANRSKEKAGAFRAVAPKRGEVRVVHALQPAPHFRGRDSLVTELTGWVADLASPDRVWSLVAAGGTGKTAVVERVVRDMRPGEASVLVWSFYEKPDADAFLRECNHLFLGEEEGPPGGRLERLERGLRDGRPHLIVLDGLERVQEDAGNGRVRGELSDQTLKLLLRAIAAGLGRARALVTSRFPLIDLQDWGRRGYRETPLDDLAPDAAVAVLRGWDVKGDDAALRATAAQVGNHALSVAVIGSYLRSFAGGRIEEAAAFDLDNVTGEDPKAAKLARVLASYADRLPPEERELLARLSVFPRGVTLEILGALVDAGGEVAGLLLNARPRLVSLLATLKKRGLVFEYRDEASATWTAHPFLRERFRGLLGCPPERVFDVVARDLGSGLEARPETNPTDSAVLDRYERLIEATRLAGRVQEAFDLYWWGLGSHNNLGKRLGDYQRGHRILAAFNQTTQPQDLAPTLALSERTVMVNNLSLFSLALGRLDEARALQQWDQQQNELLAEPDATTRRGNSAEVLQTMGRFPESLTLLSAAVEDGDSVPAAANWIRAASLAFHAFALHSIGNIDPARVGFARAEALNGSTLTSLRGALHARHLIDLGDRATARAIAEHGMSEARHEGWNDDLARFRAIFSRLDLAEGKAPTPHLDEIRAWSSRTGAMAFTIEAHLLEACHLLARGDFQSALDEAEIGLLHAVSCGYGRLRIDLLVALARIRLGWPDAPAAIQAARAALDLSTDAECQYAWGEADAAQVWGEAYLANGEPTLALRAFDRALAVRKRIQHPGVAETETWIARTRG